MFQRRLSDRRKYVAEALSNCERFVLSRELSAFLIEISIALHKHAIYPAGHPSLEPAAARVTARAERLLEDRPTIAFGVARCQLIIDGVATDPDQPVLRRLAETLHRHHLGAISILPGVEISEISSALDALAVEVDPGVPPLGLALDGRLRDWPHVRLHPLTLERLEIIDNTVPAPDGSDGQVAGRAAQLWIGLATAAMASDPALESETHALEPAIVAKAIDDHTDTVGYDQVIVGYLLQIADELKSADGADLGALRRRTARLIAALQPETLQRLVTMGGDLAQRRAFVLGATSGMAVDSVVKILKAAADASGQTISHGLVRMLSKLAAHAELGPEHVRPVADGALREQVDRLLSGWDLDDPNPTAYGRTLQYLATFADSPSDREDNPRSGDEADPLRILQMSLEVGSSGPLVERAIDRAIDAGKFRSLCWLLSSPPAGSGTVADALRKKLTAPSTIATLVAREPLDDESLDAVLPAISIDGYQVLLDALMTTENRVTRRKLLDLLPLTRLDAAPLIVARLEDERWYVQRNLLLLLERLGRVPPGFSATRWTRHPDGRVRYQALALQLTLPEERESALRSALEDRDERVTRLGLRAYQRLPPRSVTPLVAYIAMHPRMTDELRIHAVRALGHAGDRAALDALVRLTDGGKSVLGKAKLAPPTPIVLAAIQVLADVWSTDPHASDTLALARGSSDPALRQAAGTVRA
jgi:hypothetical protein